MLRIIRSAHMLNQDEVEVLEVWRRSRAEGEEELIVVLPLDKDESVIVEIVA